MRNIIKTIGLTMVSLFIAGNVYAGSMSIKIEQPKSPTNLTNLKINFVVLDSSSSPSDISAQCYKKSPSDGGFSTLGSAMTISAGGGSAYCETDGSFINTTGTYQFYVSANGIPSDTVSVDYNTSGPGNPTNYSKSRVNTCDYKITFRTADDGGKTVKVEVYRSENTSFSADNGSRVDTITIGSNTDGTSTTTPPNCSKDYYFAVRAFDAIGNGSGLVGDSITITTTTTTTTTTTGGTAGTSGTVGAIPAGTGGNVLGAANGTLEGSTGPTGAVLGEASPSGTVTPTATPTPSQKPTLFTGRNIGIGGGLLAVIILLLFLFK
jgi:hypothetical protein